MSSQQRLLAPALFAILLALTSYTSAALAGAVQSDQATSPHMSAVDSHMYRVISDEDRTLMQYVKNQIEENFASFKDVDEVHKFLDKVKLLVQKHPKNVAFAQGDLKELHKFLSEEMVTALIRVDTAPFEMPISDEKMVLAQRAVDEDDLTRKLFGGPLRSLVESRKQHVSRADDGNHRDGNFFSNFWCKISGNCAN